MEKMKQECKVKKPLKIWQGVLTLLVSAVILFLAAIVFLAPYFWMLSNSFKSTKEILLENRSVLVADKIRCAVFF